MTTVEQRKARVETLLNKQGFGLHPTQHALIDCEGDIICKLSDPFMKALDSLTDAEALVVFLEMHSLYLVCAERAHKAGIRAGRKEIISTVHELLGISRFERLGENLEGVLRESAQMIRARL